jgi:hypothetical protein
VIWCYDIPTTDKLIVEYRKTRFWTIVLTEKREITTTQSVFVQFR